MIGQARVLIADSMSRARSFMGGGAGRGNGGSGQ